MDAFGCQERRHPRGESVRRSAALQVVTPRKHDQLGIRNASGQHPAVRRRDHAVAPPADDEGRRRIAPRNGMLDQLEIREGMPHGTRVGLRPAIARPICRARASRPTRDRRSPDSTRCRARTNLRTRSGARAASCCATAPPWEKPRTSARQRRLRRAPRAASVASAAIDSGRTGGELAPTPGASKLTTVRPAGPGEGAPALQRAGHAR